MPRLIRDLDTKLASTLSQFHIRCIAQHLHVARDRCINAFRCQSKIFSLTRAFIVELSNDRANDPGIGTRPRVLRDIWSICIGADVRRASIALLSRHMAILATLHHARRVIAAKASVWKINTGRRECAVEPLGKCSLLSKHVILVHGRVRAIHRVECKMPIGLGSKDRVTDVVTCSAERSFRVIG